MKNKDFYEDYIKIFLEENSKVNLISKNDEKYLWEKHIYDSLAIKLFFEKYKLPKNLLDIGTGGGFPSVPVALTYPQIRVTGIDSIAKKIRAVNSIKEKLQLNNLELICARVETLSQKYDVIVSRAVSSLKNVSQYALPLLEKNGYFVAYKSKKAEDEIKEAQTVLKKFKAQVVDILDYDLPLDDKLTRNLVVIKI